jgi:hypothetical protein
MFSTSKRGTGLSFHKERCLQESTATKKQRDRYVHCRRTAYRLSVDGVFQCVETSSDHMVNCMGVSLCRKETFFDGNNRDTVHILCRRPNISHFNVISLKECNV